VIEQTKGDGTIDRLLIYGQSKVGKTTCTSLLKHAIVIDMEDGTKFLKCNKIDILSMMKDATGMYALRSAYTYLQKNFTGQATKEFPYDTIVLDTIDLIELWAGQEVAEENDEDYYTDIPYGAGYAMLRDKIIKLLDSFVSLGLKVIVIAHRKKNIIGEKDNMINVRDVELTGKLKNYLFAWADAIGYMSRKYDGELSKTILSFKNEETEYLEGGCRLKQLEGQDIELITMDKKREVIANNWSKIFN